ncbi:SAM-dependent methyltransferase [Amycolatopsis sp. cg5]|uniref:SAM-dependent methyltransferase n=1 Tax=Amycolatopsis sp. cg5 TaxID=3238802 RepID=UPI0035256D24
MSDIADPPYAPKGVDLEHPSVARIYDWFIGGTTNWAVDREFGAMALKVFPQARMLARTNREFLRRAVRYCSEQGIHQFLDIGSGVPTVGNVHEVAQEVDPTSRVVYVDNEPVAVAHSKILLEQHGDLTRHAAINADFLDHANLWDQAMETGVLDPRRPIALLTVALLHFMPQGMGAEVSLEYYKTLLPSGSYLIASHGTNDGVPDDVQKQQAILMEQYKNTASPVVFRDRAEFTALFDGFDLVEPGAVWIPEWRLDDKSPMTEEMALTPNASCGFAGVARKP